MATRVVNPKALLPPTIEEVDPPAGEAFYVSPFVGKHPEKFDLVLEHKPLVGGKFQPVLIEAVSTRQRHIVNEWKEGFFRVRYRKRQTTPTRPRQSRPRLSGTPKKRKPSPWARTPKYSAEEVVDWPDNIPD